MKKISTNSKKRNNTFIIIVLILVLATIIFFYFYNKKYTNFINSKDKDGLTPIMKLFINEKDKSENILEIKKIIFENRRKIDYSIVDNNKKTLLMYAVFYGDIDIIREIVKYCNNCINAVDDDGRSALHIAVYYNNIEAVKTLLELGANRDLIDNYNLKAIDLAEFEGYEDIYNLLLNETLN